jgi:tRNA modification GTPase
MIDEALVVLMRAPHTYTREDCLEIQAHGGPRVLQEILDLLLRLGARLARPGEFTLRAFLNGRIDLTQAEAVVDLIQANTRSALEMARRQLKGRLSRHLLETMDEILEVLALLEAQIEFPEEEDIPPPDPTQVLLPLQNVEHRLKELILTYGRGKLCKEGAHVAILGAPNAGKSSLLNALLGYERAIVTEIPGTTRDLVEETLEWKGLPIRAIDTAGLRPPQDPIEAEGLRLLLERIPQADLIIWVVDGSRPFDVDVSPVAALMQKIPCIVALNKSDLPQRCFPQDLPDFAQSFPVLSISAKDGTGLERLLDTARELLMGTVGTEEFLLSNLRHKELLERVLQDVNRALEGFRQGLYVELIASDLRDAIAALEEILGRRADGEVLHRIFEKFCIGK